MQEQAKTKVNQSVYRQFPELEGKQPSITSRPDGDFLLSYRGSVTMENGRTLERVVRVVVSETGRIKKLTTSR
jgi:hypothetical protein